MAPPERFWSRNWIVFPAAGTWADSLKTTVKSLSAVSPSAHSRRTGVEIVKSPALAVPPATTTSAETTPVLPRARLTGRFTERSPEAGFTRSTVDPANPRIPGSKGRTRIVQVFRAPSAAPTADCSSSTMVSPVGAIAAPKRMITETVFSASSPSAQVTVVGSPGRR